MKKVIFTFLGVLFFGVVAQAQSSGTVFNNSDCDFEITFIYGSSPDCSSSGPTTRIVVGGSSLAMPLPAGSFYIVGAEITRVINSGGTIFSCSPTYSIYPPPTGCGTCTGGSPQSFTTPFDGDCCSEVVNVNWSEINCTGGNSQSTLLTFN